MLLLLLLPGLSLARDLCHSLECHCVQEPVISARCHGDTIMVRCPGILLMVIFMRL